MVARWHRAIAYALVGEDLPLPSRPAPDIGALPDELDARGWPTGRVVARARAASETGVWPFPVPKELRSGMSGAQLQAAVREARLVYGLDAIRILPPSRRTDLTRDERRLLEDVPPHY